eukprot:TRINITY_DN5757_c0_g2_i1.p1 TRINITY_DN5757_c0_g2~~TRINITY_DN5757_c0_g2_i1.p1  ORF type:complete len:717 (-),score=215.62 TRINITY_DN5757_c0_g2_i1:365-2515(-)
MEASPVTSSSMASPGPEEFVRAICVRAYQATDDNQLELRVNDIVCVMEKDDSGWWGGHKEGDSVTAWFPGVCVRELHEQGRAILENMKTDSDVGTAANGQAAAAGNPQKEMDASCASPNRAPVSDYAGRSRNQVASPQFSSWQDPQRGDTTSARGSGKVPAEDAVSAEEAEAKAALVKELAALKKKEQQRDAAEAAKERRLQELERQLESERQEKARLRHDLSSREAALNEAKQASQQLAQQSAAKEPKKELEQRLKAEASEKNKLASEVESIKNQLEKERRTSQAAQEEAKRLWDLVKKEQQEKEQAISEKRKSFAQIDSLKEELKAVQLDVSVRRSQRGSIGGMPDMSDVVDENPDMRKNLFSSGFQLATTPGKSGASDEAPGAGSPARGASSRVQPAAQAAPRGSPLPPTMGGGSPAWAASGSTPPQIARFGRSQTAGYPSPNRSESLGAMPLGRRHGNGGGRGDQRTTSPARADMHRRAESQGPSSSGRTFLTEEAPPAGCVRSKVQQFEKRSATPRRRSTESTPAASPVDRSPAARFLASIGSAPVMSSTSSAGGAAAPRRRRVSGEDFPEAAVNGVQTVKSTPAPVSVRPLDLQALRSGGSQVSLTTSGMKDFSAGEEDLNMSPMHKTATAPAKPQQASGSAQASWATRGSSTPSFSTALGTTGSVSAFQTAGSGGRGLAKGNETEDEDKPSVSVKDRVRSWQRNGSWNA